MLNHVVSKKNRALLSELVRTDFKLRYQGSVLGYTWSLLRPLFIFLITYIVFAKFLKIGDEVPNYPIYLLLGIVLWQFFSDVTIQGLGSIVARGDLIRKIRIPRWMIVISSSLGALINLVLNFIVIAVFMVLNHVEISRSVIWLPMYLLEIYLFGLGLALLLSAAFVKYRDFSFIWDIALQAGFYLTPIIYPLSVLAGFTIAGITLSQTAITKIMLVNPMAQSIQDIRNAIVTSETVTISDVFGSSWALLIPVFVCLITLLCGILYFKHQSTHFAENL